jgi:hypothetical protein
VPDVAHRRPLETEEEHERRVYRALLDIERKCHELLVEASGEDTAN